MKAIKCDRCGKYQDSRVREADSKAFLSPTSAAVKIEHEHYIITRPDIRWVDLCEDCTKEFMEEFMRLFKKYNIPPNLIQVEIIERSVMDSNTLCEITNRLHKEGFSVAMDDFGSGESSLNMLTKIPVDVLKFDREFLLSSTNENGTLEEKSAKFIQSLIDLSKNLEKETIFEGVETKAQRDFLKSIKCDQVQGYFYSRPLIETDFLVFMNEHLPKNSKK